MSMPIHLFYCIYTDDVLFGHDNQDFVLSDSVFK